MDSDGRLVGTHKDLSNRCCRLVGAKPEFREHPGHCLDGSSLQPHLRVGRRVDFLFVQLWLLGDGLFRLGLADLCWILRVRRCL